METFVFFNRVNNEILEISGFSEQKGHDKLKLKIYFLREKEFCFIVGLESDSG